MTKVEALRQAQLNLIRGTVNSELLVRRGIGGIGKLGEVPAPKAPSQDSTPAAISRSHPFSKNFKIDVALIVQVRFSDAR